MANETALYSLEHMGTTPPTVSELTPPVCPPSSSQGAEMGATPPQVLVGQGLHNHNGDLMFFRMARVERQIASLQVVPDDDLLQHAADKTRLMEQAFACWRATGNLFAYDKALEYLRQRDAARRLLSKEWQERREAEILAGCSAGYFIDAGDKSRAQIAANEERGG